MADIIRLTKEELEGVATRFDTAAEEICVLLNELSCLVEGMSSGWEGERYDAFYAKFEKFRTNIMAELDTCDDLRERVKAEVIPFEPVDDLLRSMS